MDFAKWLQERLNIHGAKLIVDGAIGYETQQAIKAFQKRKKLKQTGTATKNTISALRNSPQKGVSKAPVFAQRTPPWLDELTRRMGLHEVRDKSRLNKFLRIGKKLGDPAKLPWCGDAVESALIPHINEKVPANPFWAQGWKDWGRDAGGPICGSIAIIKWNSKAGHIGLVVGVKKDSRGRITHIILRGGNQGNMIKDSAFPYKTTGKGAFIAFRWPNSVPITKYPYLVGDAASGGGVAATR